MKKLVIALGFCFGLASAAFGQANSPGPQIYYAVNVKANAGAKGDTVSYSDGTIAASGTTLSSASVNCSAADVGKSIILHGSGASSVPQLGTISACSGNSFTTSFTASHLTPWSGTWSAAVAATGSGYTNGAQTLTVSGGTCATQPQFSVTVVGNVVPLGATLTSVTPGDCSVLPANPAATTGGGGTGATLTLTGYQVGGQFTYGTDDSAAVASAVTQANAAGKAVYFPAGAYWLATQSSAIALNNLTIYGDGWPSNAWPYTGGTTLLIGNKTTSVFSGMSSVIVRDLAIYYPEQDNSQASPVVFPATFESAAFVNDIFTRVRALNAYQFLTVDATAATSGLGRVFLDNVMAYCVDKCFNLLNGNADTLQFSATNYFGPGGFGSAATAGPATLVTYTHASGEWIHLDSSGGGYANFDGILATGGLVQGYRYGVRLVSGVMDVSNFSNINFDSVGTLLSIEGTSSVITTSITGGEVYSTNGYAATQSANVINCASNAGTSKLVISGVTFSFAQGAVIKDTGSCFALLNFSSNKVENWGRSTTGGAYAALWESGNSSADWTVSGNIFNCNQSVNTIDVIITSQINTPTKTITGNNFVTCQIPVTLNGTTGLDVLTGNTSTGTVGGQSLFNSSTGTVKDSNNTWDKPRAPTVATGSTDCGTSPSFASGSDDNRGRLTVGSSTNGGKCTVTFRTNTTINPICTVYDETTGSIGVTSVPSSTTVTAFTGVVVAGNVLSYTCNR